MTPTRARLLFAVALWLAACGTEIEDRIVYRSTCEVCHRPLSEDGVPEGIEDPHPWFALECTDCHGGQAWVCDGLVSRVGEELRCDGTWIYDQELAHVGPGSGPAYLKNLAAGQLDAVNLDYVRFVNPGDLRVAWFTCGGGSPRAGESSGCHSAAVERTALSPMAHAAGEIGIARYRAGVQESPIGTLGAISAIDPAFEEGPCAVETIGRFAPDGISAEGGDDPLTGHTVSAAQEQYLVKTCFRCHLSSFGANDAPGDYRSSGCSACHVLYAEDGLSRSSDPWVDRQSPPHAVTHQLVRSPPTEQCTRCHASGGARIGLSYRGIREAAGPGLDAPGVVAIDRPLHGRAAGFFITDEDGSNDFDETPPDVHFEAGMSCADCHGAGDAHGDGRLKGRGSCAVTVRCEDCHGSVRKAATAADHSATYERDGALYLKTGAGDKELGVPQSVDSVTPGHPRYSPLAAQLKGVGEDGFTHADQLECVTCHSGWMPSCYGCHVDVDLAQEQAYQTTGILQSGRITEGRRWVQLNDLVLMRAASGKYAPSMPAERLFMSLFGADDGFSSKPRTTALPDGRTIAGFGQRPIDPHTTRRRSAFMACDRCHSVGDPAAPENDALLRITFGFGTERFPQAACDVTNEDKSCNIASDFVSYRLDAVQTEAHETLVVPEGLGPDTARPLNGEEVAKMRAVVVPAAPPLSTPTSEKALTDPRWPPAQKLE